MLWRDGIPDLELRRLWDSLALFLVYVYASEDIGRFEILERDSGNRITFRIWNVYVMIPMMDSAVLHFNVSSWLFQYKQSL